MTHKTILLYSCLAQPSLEKLPLAEYGENAETHSQTAGRVRDHRTLSPKGDAFIKFLRDQGALCKKTQSVRAKETEGSKRNQGLLGTTGLDHIETQIEAACSHGLHRSASIGVLEWEGKVDISLHP